MFTTAKRILQKSAFKQRFKAPEADVLSLVYFGPIVNLEL